MSRCTFDSYDSVRKMPDPFLWRALVSPWMCEPALIPPPPPFLSGDTGCGVEMLLNISGGCLSRYSFYLQTAPFQSSSCARHKSARLTFILTFISGIRKEDISPLLDCSSRHIVVYLCSQLVTYGLFYSFPEPASALLVLLRETCSSWGQPCLWYGPRLNP